MTTNNTARINRVLALAETLPGYSGITTANEYAEPGYDAPDSGVIAFANWNPDSFATTATKEQRTMRRLGDILEKLGVECEWSDQWSTCDCCGKAVRTSPDSYGWKRSFWLDDCEIVCMQCVLDDPAAYLDAAENNPEFAVTFDLDLAEYGYNLLEGNFQRGLHHGQAASPHVIAKELRELDVTRFLFVLDDTGQFDETFSVWVHDERSVYQA